MLLLMWTPTELASKARPFSGEAWRVVEHQHTVSTRKIVDTLEEQDVLEGLLEHSKPPYPPAAKHLHYLLKTPFRYPPSPFASRFRRPNEGSGVFYCSEKIRTSLAEFSYWRRRFIAASPGTPLPKTHEALTVFSVSYQSQLLLDLLAQPFNADRDRWTQPEDYSATHRLAELARRGGVDSIRYESVRDPEHGVNLALLDPRVFACLAPLVQQTWYLYLDVTESNCIRAGHAESFTFPMM